MRSSLLGGLVVAAVCVPCLLTLLVAAGLGTAALSAIGAWFTDSYVLAAAAVAAVAFSLLAWAMYTRRARQADCVVPEAEEAQVGR